MASNNMVVLLVALIGATATVTAAWIGTSGKRDRGPAPAIGTTGGNSGFTPNPAPASPAPTAPSGAEPTTAAAAPNTAPNTDVRTSAMATLATVDISGVWTDRESVTLRLQQQGNLFTFHNPLDGTLLPGSGGAVTGRNVSFTLTGAPGFSVRCNGTVTGDNQRIDMACESPQGVSETGSFWRVS
ncbi:hypothetical protein [Sandaracinobacteroides saxicola]|uniref:Uncharacterized protein n=1 Tax=Sandaracinobacteroides saxicola TaxID=2759707 RepID=A0A7G5IJS6_9SPHN|nr:hypothetical protein [Sandaracinobacteroides saxicola]QMW23618.1 hypothetical protein H3309_03750 [Sandaracinobacteroides saxicola]